jgi:hypothetical protein
MIMSPVAMSNVFFNEKMCAIYLCYLGGMICDDTMEYTTICGHPTFKDIIPHLFSAKRPLLE